MEHLSSSFKTKEAVLINTIFLESTLAFAFTICSFVVSNTANSGFNCVLTSLLNIGFLGGSYYIIKNSKAPIAVGFMIGSSIMITFLDLLTAHFWGQLSYCNKYGENIPQYSCENRTAYSAVSTFGYLLFLTNICFSICIYIWRFDILSGNLDSEDLFTGSFPNEIFSSFRYNQIDESKEANV